MLPTFIVIGAMKAGTTSLHYYLGLHPEIGMSAIKELDFFCAEKNWDRGVDWYRQQFPDRPLRGEASPGYTKHPRFSGVVPRMHAVVPEASLVYLVRDPIDRIVSHYLDAMHWGREHRPFDEALADLDDNHYVNCSLYEMQIREYDGYYPRERIHVVVSEDLRERRAETLAGIYGFLGADPGFSSPETERVLWTAGEKERLTRVGYAMRAVSRRVGRTPLRRVLPYSLARGVQRFNAATARELRPPEVSAALRARLTERIRPDTDRFREWAGMDLAAWSV